MLFMSSEVLNEPVAWGGPVVMNTREELQEAWKELENEDVYKRQENINCDGRENLMRRACCIRFSAPPGNPPL